MRGAIDSECKDIDMADRLSEKEKSSPGLQKPTVPLENEYLGEAIKFILEGITPSNLAKIGDLSLPAGSKEAQRCDELQSILEDYAGRTTSRPFSIPYSVRLALANHPLFLKS